MKKTKLDLLRPGNWKDKSGKIIKVTKEMISKIADATKSFSYQNNTFPFTIGHPEEDSPAYGWGNKSNVSVDDRGHLQLEAGEEDFNPALVDMIRKKMFKTLSVKTRKDGSIRHVAFLGATPPAVTGLDPVEFGDNGNEGSVFEFSDFDINEHDDVLSLEFGEYELSNYPFRTIGTLFRRMKNWFIDQYGQEEADRVFPEYELESAGDTPRIFSPVKESEFSEQINNEDDMDKLAQMQEQLNNLQTTNTELQKKLTAATSQLTEKERREKFSTAVAFCESDEMKKRIPPALGTNRVANLLVELDAVGELEFSEGEETIKENAADTLKSILKLLPEFEFAEMANSGSKEDGKSDAAKLGEQIASYAN